MIAEGIYHDLETNSAGRATVRRSIADRSGRIFKDDMIAVTGNAACSIAKRNAILAGVPKSVWNRAYVAAREVVAGTVKTLAVSRDQALAAFANFGVKPEQIFPAIGVAGPEEITLDHIPVLRGMFSAIKNGEATVEEMFAAPKTASNHLRVVDPLKDEAPAQKIDQAPAAPEQPSPTQDDAEVNQQDAPKSDPAAADPDPADPREALLADLRDAIDGGTRVTKLLNEMPSEKRDLLTDEDVKALRQREKAAGDRS